MNGSQQTAETGEATPPKVQWRQVVAILVAAITLGLIYNIASPLGVRAPKAETPVVVPSGKTNKPTQSHHTLVFTNSTNVVVTPSQSQPDATTLKWADVKPLLELGQIVLVDARAKAVYDIEHIPGAVSLPTESAPEDFMAFVQKHPPDTAIVVYCGGETCDLSHELGEKLRKDLGYTNVREMPGGIIEYRLAEGKSSLPGAK